MFCHRCGKKLVSGARFCSWCSAAVPAEILEAMEGVQPSDEPVPVPEKKPEPPAAPVPEPVPAKGPEPAEEPEPAPAPAPEPIIIPVREPEPPASGPAPEKEPEPAEEPKPAFAPVSEPVPVPVKKTEQAEQPEKIVALSLQVTAQQVEREDRITLEHEMLLEPVTFQLRSNMRTGTRVRVPEARMKPSDDGMPQTLLVSLWVTHAVTAASAAMKAPSAPGSAPAAAPVPDRTKSVVPAAAQPRKTVSFVPVTLTSGFQLCSEDELKTGFRFNGADDIGNVVVSPEHIRVYKKSKAVGMAFGAIGSAIEGQGKLVKTVYPENVFSFEKREVNRRLYECILHLRGKQLLKINVSGKNMEEALEALDLFASQR